MLPPDFSTRIFMKRLFKNVFALLSVPGIVFFLSQAAHGQNKTINVNLYANNDPYNNSQWNNQLITQPSYPFTSGTYNYSDATASTVYTTISASQGPTTSTYADNGAGYATAMCPSSVPPHGFQIRQQVLQDDRDPWTAGASLAAMPMWPA